MGQEGSTQAKVAGAAKAASSKAYSWWTGDSKQNKGQPAGTITLSVGMKLEAL